VPGLRERTAAVGVTGQGDGTWLVDKSNKPVTEAWLWLDARAGPTVRRLRGAPADRARYEATGSGLNVCQQGSQLAHMKATAPEIVAATDAAMLDLFPANEPLARWIQMAQQKVRFQGLPARICWLGYGERHLAGLRFNELVGRGDVQAPIVIGRDHLDCGSVASPYRETEAMADGSDAIADWPLLNALVAASSGASWVSIHHGGGVGIGRSIHAGQVCVADGTALAAQKLERVLTNDPGMGVIRHADAGYDEASRVAAARGVRVPMSESAPAAP